MLLPHPRGPPKPPGHPIARSLKENRDVYPEYPQRRVVLRSRNLYVLLNAEGDAPALVEGGLRDFFLPRDQQPADEIRRPPSSAGCWSRGRKKSLNPPSTSAGASPS